MPLKADRGIGLVWLQPWDGSEQIPFSDLDPLYIEVCRRVRLQNAKGRLHAVAATSKKPRIAAGELKVKIGGCGVCSRRFWPSTHRL